MTTKRNDTMNFAARRVKKVAKSAFGFLALATGAIAPNAFANGALLVDRTVSVKFSLTELRAPQGPEKIYAKLEKRAMSFCRADKATLRYLDQSLAECANDIVDQFVQSVNIIALTDYHKAQTNQARPVQIASN